MAAAAFFDAALLRRYDRPDPRGHGDATQRRHQYDQDLAEVAAAGLKEGVSVGYVPKTDVRVIVATPMVGGGATTRAKLAGGKLKAGGDYSSFCSFPGRRS